MWSAIADLYQKGVISIETAVQMLGLVNAPMEEVERIKSAKQGNVPLNKNGEG